MDPVKQAFDDICYLADIFKKLSFQDEMEKKFRTRASSMPSIIQGSGLVSSLTFMLSKIKAENFKKLAEVMQNRADPAKAAEVLEHLKSRAKASSEDLSYGLYLYFVLNYLASFPGILQGVAVNNPIEACKALLKTPHAASLLLEHYLIEIKKLSEALFKEES